MRRAVRVLLALSIMPMLLAVYAVLSAVRVLAELLGDDCEDWR